MGQTTKIQWADHTFNPWRGCTKVSAGCANCYAETLSKRNPGVMGVWGDNGTRVVASEAKWREPLKWDREAEAAGVRRRVFFSLGDPFEDREELKYPRSRLLDTIQHTPSLDWLLLTKRPENILELLGDACPSGMEYPIPNVWLGVSAENQEQADKRIPILLSIPAAVRFVSCEPMLGPIDWEDAEALGVGAETCHRGVSHASNKCDCLPAVDWIIFGGESGPNSRPCNIQWIRDGVRQCKQANVKAFVKQLGAKPFVDEKIPGLRMGAKWPTSDLKGGDPWEWPEDLRVREVPGC